MKYLRRVAEGGAAAYRHMLEIGHGIGALPDDEREAIHDYEETFGLDGDGAPMVLALLDVAEDAHQMFRAWDDDAISRADQDAAYDELAASFERLREVIEANAVLARANLRLTYGV